MGDTPSAEERAAQMWKDIKAAQVAMGPLADREYVEAAFAFEIHSAERAAYRRGLEAAGTCKNCGHEFHWKCGECGDLMPVPDEKERG